MEIYLFYLSKGILCAVVCIHVCTIEGGLNGASGTMGRHILIPISCGHIVACVYSYEQGFYALLAIQFVIMVCKLSLCQTILQNFYELWVYLLYFVELLFALKKNSVEITDERVEYISCYITTNVLPNSCSYS